MTEDDLYTLFEEHSGFYLESTATTRVDLIAFNRLAELVPGKKDIISGAKHDQIWIGISAAELAEVATEEDIIFLLEHGLLCDESEGLYMHA